MRPVAVTGSWWSGNGKFAIDGLSKKVKCFYVSKYFISGNFVCSSNNKVITSILGSTHRSDVDNFVSSFTDFQHYLALIFLGDFPGNVDEKYVSHLACFA